ncbi:MAG TPA: prenyltransferase [Opitutaceae bacterium]|nr:prenyltransferase [Opitutaceae bacterium]
MTKPAFWLGLWRLGDPRLTLASLSSLAIGTAAAGARGPVQIGWLVLTVVGIVAIEVAKNASGDIADFDSGADQAVAPADRSPFSGGRRVLVDGLLSRRQTAAISGCGYGIGIAAGVIIAIGHEPRVLAVGLLGTALAWCYGSKPLQLAYHGLGELAVALNYGPLICCGAYLVQRHRLDGAIVFLSLPIGLLVGAFLWINEFPDYPADRHAGKRNWVVRLGRPRAAAAFVLILAAAFGCQAALPAFGWPWASWLGFAGLPLAAAAGRRTLSSPEDTSGIIPAQRLTLESFVLSAAATAAGLLLHPGP